MAIPTQDGVNQKVANRLTARVIPIVIVGIVGYVSYVVIVLVCVKYLLRPQIPLHKPRNGAAIGIIVGYSMLLLLIAVTYLRLVCTVILNPGYVPRGPQWYAQREQKTQLKRARDAIKEMKSSDPDGNKPEKDSETFSIAYGSEPRPQAQDEASAFLEEFSSKEVYTCEGNGKPIWCSYCSNWKPDRAHHCREVGRCVRKMDHFCPWVGGVVGETSFKFFVQFTGWAAIYCIFILVLISIVISEVRHQPSSHLSGHYLVTISLAAFFTLFTVGMTGSSLQFLVLNSSTIENLSRRTKVWQLAVHVPRPLDSAAATRLPSIAYPLVRPNSAPEQVPQGKVFAILRSKPGENPWDRGALENIRSVMGKNWYDWILPIKHSPCRNHEREDSQFALGPVVDRMRAEVGLIHPQESVSVDAKRRRRRRRSRKSRTRSKQQTELSSQHQGESGAKKTPVSGIASSGVTSSEAPYT